MVVPGLRRASRRVVADGGADHRDQHRLRRDSVDRGSPRPFWHPFITAQCFGLAIAYCVNAGTPWEKSHPVWRLALAVAAGTAIGFALLVLVKIVVLGAYSWDELRSRRVHEHWSYVVLMGLQSARAVAMVGEAIAFRMRRSRAERRTATA